MNNINDFYASALPLAHELYGHKKRSGGDRPYITHPLMLVDILMAHGHLDDVLLSGALLHDAVEENDHDAKVILRLAEVCPSDVFNLIMEVTDTPGLDREARRSEQLSRAKGYSRFACLIRLADKMANLTDILNQPPRWASKHIVSYSEFAMRIVLTCAHADHMIANKCRDLHDEISNRYANQRGNKQSPIISQAERQ